MAFCFAQRKCLSQTGVSVEVFCGRSFYQHRNCTISAALALRLVAKVSSLESFFSLREGGNVNHKMKERHKGNYFVNVYAKIWGNRS